MKDSDNRKDSRRQNMQNQSRFRQDIPDEQKFLNKSKKRLKKEIENTRADELWEDWENSEE